MEEEGEKYLRSNLAEVVYTNESEDDQKSEYEKLVEKNCAEKMAFLQTLNIDEAKANLVEEVARSKFNRSTNTTKSIQPNRKPFRKIDYPAVVGLRSKSRRLNKVGNLSEKALHDKVYEAAKLANENKTKAKKKTVNGCNRKKTCTSFEKLNELLGIGKILDTYSLQENEHLVTAERNDKNLPDISIIKEIPKTSSLQDKECRVRTEHSNTNLRDISIKVTPITSSLQNNTTTSKFHPEKGQKNGLSAAPFGAASQLEESPFVWGSHNLPGISISKVPKTCFLQHNEPMTTKKGTPVRTTEIRNAVVKENVSIEKATGLKQKSAPLAEKKRTEHVDRNLPDISIIERPSTPSLQNNEHTVIAEHGDSNLSDILIIEENEPMTTKTEASIKITDVRSTAVKENVSVEKSTGLKRKLPLSNEMDSAAKKSEKPHEANKKIRQEETPNVVNSTTNYNTVNRKIWQKEKNKVVNDTNANHKVNRNITQTEEDKVVKDSIRNQELMIEQLKELNSNLKVVVNVLHRLEKKSDQMIILLNQ